jgi:hypothetical protein
MRHLSAGFINDLAQGQRDQFQIGQQTLKLGLGQRCQQMVFTGLTGLEGIGISNLLDLSAEREKQASFDLSLGTTPSENPCVRVDLRCNITQQSIVHVCVKRTHEPSELTLLLHCCSTKIRLPRSQS